MKIYRILENGYYGGEEEIPDGTLGIPLFTTRTAPPEIPPGRFGFWNGSGWDVIDHLPPVPQAPVEIPVAPDPVIVDPVIVDPTPAADPTPPTE